jgi:hypothetical protein
MQMENSTFTWAADVPLIMDQKLLETIEIGGTRAIDKFLLPWVNQLKDEYKRIGNPVLIYQAGKAVCIEIKSIQSCHSSFQYSRLQALLAEMLLASGRDSRTLLIAMSHLECAIETIQRVSTINNDVVRAHVFYVLLLGITKKAVGCFDESLKIMNSAATSLINEGIATELDLIPLRRQEIMMYQTISGYEQLAEDAIKYAVVQPLEYYRSLKRVFEFLLNEGGQQKAEQIYPEFKRAFIAVASKVPPISLISFMKNVGQYQMSVGNTQEASAVFTRTLVEANQRNLYGQVRQVKRLIQELESDTSRGKLVTFGVSSLISCEG